LKEFAMHAPTTFYSKTSQATLGQGGSNEFLNYIFEAVRDPQPIVRACAADALSQCLKILMDRQHKSLTGLLCQVHFAVMEGLEEVITKKSWSAITKVEATQHGSLLVVSTMIAHTRDFMLPRFVEICNKVLDFCMHPKALIRLEVIRLIPRLARRCPRIFARRYLEQSLAFLLTCASTQAPPRSQVDLRPSAFSSIGFLVLAMVDADSGEVLGGDSLPTVKILDDPERPGERHIVELSETGVIYSRLADIFRLVSDGLKSRTNTSQMHIAVFHCAADLIEALDDMALPYLPALIDDMFRAGLSNDLIQCLQSIAECIPEQQSVIEDRLLQEVSMCLAGIKSAREASHAAAPGMITPSLRGRGQTTNDDDQERSRRDAPIQHSIEYPRVRINMSSSPQDVNDLVLSLHTLGSFGDSIGRVTTSEGVVPLLPFVQKVASKYLYHSSSEVRRAAALTCCTLLVPPGLVHKRRIGGCSSRIIEDVLDVILQVAVSDPSPVVRLCIVRALDARYDIFLCQAHHLKPLFLLLQDEILATRAAAVHLIGRLATINPAPVLPYMRKFLLDLIVELDCGVDTGRGREEATRLLVVFLKSKSMKRLVNPVLPAVVQSLPLNGATPRLASAALEALGELAKAAGASLQPWVKELMPTILKTLQDQSSASKQRTSLRTLSLIAGSTGYVIQPYIDYPNLLAQAADILPGTKRAPWALRREVIRTLGVLGALDPDRYNVIAPQTGKGGAVGGAYFIVHEDAETSKFIPAPEESGFDTVGRSPLVYSNVFVNGQATAAKISSSFVSSKVPGLDSGTIGRKTSFIMETLKDLSVENDDDLPAYLSMYEQYAMVAQPVSSLAPPRRMTPGDEEFYPTVAIQALMRIFKDPSLANHHGMGMQAIMFIFKSLGLRCVPFLNKVVPHIMFTIRTCGPSNLRESLLKQVATLSGIVREHLRPYVADIFDIVEQFWSSRHLGTIFSLILHLASGVSDEFKRFVPRLIRRVLTSLDEMQVGDWASESGKSNHIGALRETERLRLILSSIRNLRAVLGEYLHVLVPALLKLSDSLVPRVTGDDWAIESDFSGLTVLALQTVSALLECEGSGSTVRSTTPYWGEKSGACIRSGSLSARAVQPLIRMLGEKCEGNKFIGTAIIETLCVCAKQLGRTNWIALYHRVARSAIELWQRSVLDDDPVSSLNPGIDTYATNDTGLDNYDLMIRSLESPPLQRSYNDPLLHEGVRMARRQDSLLLFGGEPLQPMFSENHGMTSGFDSTVDVFDTSSSQQANKRKIDQARLQRAWDVTQCASRDDWDEWMRRLAIHLLREAPSPALRAAASLAHAYQPLARELFSAAFVCCWKGLSETYRVNLVHALETAFAADVSPEILQTLLNLAEFMEHDDDGGLPIDISILADLALKCRAYAKALHYKEREHSMGDSSSCVEALISVNRKLDLPEAALGVLKSATMRLEQDRRTGNHDFSSDLVRQHQTTEMYYSVVWSTQGVSAAQLNGLDLAENKELWLAKLGSWTEALEVYDEKLIRNPHDFDAILGCMRCLSASGEWRRVLELAEDNWPTLTGNNLANLRHDLSNTNSPPMNIAKRDQKKALRMCADAAWRLGQWDDLDKFCSELVHGQTVGQMSPAQTNSGGNLDQLVGHVDFDGAFFSAVLHIHRNEWKMAAAAIDAARMIMDSRFTALMTESYNRAYPSMVTAQTLAEMEEIIEFKKVDGVSHDRLHKHPANSVDHAEARDRLLAVWRDRLAGCRVDADVHSSILAVRSLILGPADEVDATLTLSELSREAQRFKLAERVLLDPLHALGASLDAPAFGFGLAEALELRAEIEASMTKKPYSKIIDELVSETSTTFLPRYDERHEEWCRQLVEHAGGLDRLNIQHRLYFAFLRHLWLTDRRDEAMDRMSRLCDIVDMVAHCQGSGTRSLRASCWLELGEWRIEEMTVPGQPLPEDLQVEVLCDFKRAVTMDTQGYRGWHAWALLNFRLAVQMNEREDIQGTTLSRKRGGPSSSMQKNHVTTAIRSFVKAISLGTKRWSASVQQDMLNLLTCLFRYGEQSSIAQLVIECVATVAIDTWLGVLPQLLARIHIKSPSIRSVLHPLLVKLGEKHPQALIYPLSVLLKSPVTERKVAAEALMNSLRSHSSALVEEAMMVSSELIRVAILWLETWHEGLEEASRLYFGESNVSGMLDLLVPLHEKLECGAETHRENDFINSFGNDLAQAHIHIKDYKRLAKEDGGSIPTGSAAMGSYDPSGRLRQNEEAETAMNKAWDIYYTVFRRINKQLPALTKLELNQCSPALSCAQSLELGVPGSYRVDGTYVKIEKFISSVQVITSKQRPRKITIRGSDGKDYVFLLKGHEDLRQDERVMQLFGLVNALLERDRQTKKHDLRIQRYAISPLSHNCGLVGWVPHTDTLHSLIRDYRSTKKIPLNLEHREMLKLAPDFDLLTVMQKVEVFTDALSRTTGKGNDLYEILWLKSTNSEEWLERRTKYTRSLAVMSMVGYILGLGDRHPSNLMLDKLSGRVLHIDFGEYFCTLESSVYSLLIIHLLSIKVIVSKWP
jgi:tetratricopeptide (TPR) repeat protein